MRLEGGQSLRRPLRVLLVLTVLACLASCIKGSRVGDQHASESWLARSFTKETLTKYTYELAAIVCLAVYATILIFGRRANYSIATSFSDNFACPDNILSRNFSEHGSIGSPENKGYWQDGANSFKFYASGRRHCSGMLITLDLKSRQDLLLSLWRMLSPQEDLVQVDVFMNEPSMPQMVLAVASTRIIRQMAKETADILRFCSPVSVSKDRMPNWPSDSLGVMAESSSLFYDIFSEPKVQHLFAKDGPVAAQTSKYFRCLHFSSEQTGAYPHKLSFTFAVPPKDRMDDLLGLMVRGMKHIYAAA